MDEQQATPENAQVLLKRAHGKQGDEGKKAVQCEPRHLYFFPKSKTLDIDTKHGIPVKQCPQGCGVCNFKGHECLPTKSTYNVPKLVLINDLYACVEVREDTNCTCGTLTEERERELNSSVAIEKILNDSACMSLAKALLNQENQGEGK